MRFYGSLLDFYTNGLAKTTFQTRSALDIARRAIIETDWICWKTVFCNPSKTVVVDSMIPETLSFREKMKRHGKYSLLKASQMSNGFSNCVYALKFSKSNRCVQAFLRTGNRSNVILRTITGRSLIIYVNRPFELTSTIFTFLSEYHWITSAGK